MLRGWVALILVACGTTPPPDPPTWHSLDSGETSALLAVWGTSSHDVWVVGGRPSLAAGPTVLHYDGSAWTRLDTQQASLDLWWVFGVGSDVYFTGTGGAILRYRNNAFERLTTPSTTGTIFGLWGSSETDLWAVGDTGTTGGVVWHSSDGQTFTTMTIPDSVPTHVFKVHGQGSNDVWMSCSDGSTLHWDGQLTRVPTPTTNPLFSIITTPAVSVAVGGVGGEANLLENTGSGWNAASFDSTSPWRGTAAFGTDIAAVGENALVVHRVDGKWSRLKHDLTTLNFHSAWIDDKHGLWVVGGLFDGRLSDGVMLYYGPESIAEVVQ